MKTTVPLILASGSPRRKQLLSDLGLEFSVIVREIDETIPSGMGAVEAAEYLAHSKCAAFPDMIDSHAVITADTIVVQDGDILGKPADRAEAVAMLKALSGKRSQVITGVCVAFEGQFHVFHSLTEVEFFDLESAEIDHYVDVFRPYDKAGAYGIQEWIGMVGIAGIHGDYYNVVGLPTPALWRKLRELGLVVMGSVL